MFNRAYLAVASFAVGLASAHAASSPANICVELSAWMEKSQSTTGAEGAANAQTPRPPSPPSDANSTVGGTAVEQPVQGSRKLPEGSDVQKSSGMSGQVPQSGPAAAGPQGEAQERAQSSARTHAPKTAAPAAPPAAKAPPPSSQAIDMARQAAGADDLAACAKVVRDMRLAGVELPAPLIALAALKPQLRRMAPRGPAPGVPPIPPSGIEPQPGVAPADAPPAESPGR